MPTEGYYRYHWYQVSKFYRDGRIVRSARPTLKAAHHLAQAGSRPGHVIDRCTVKRVTTETHVLPDRMRTTIYYDQVGTWQGNIYYSIRRWRKLHPEVR